MVLLRKKVIQTLQTVQTVPDGGRTRAASGPPQPFVLHSVVERRPRSPGEGEREATRGATSSSQRSECEWGRETDSERPGCVAGWERQRI